MIKTVFKVGFVVLALAGAAAVWLHFSESDALKAERFAKQAAEFRAQGKLDEALVTWRRAVALDPARGSYRVELARLYLDNNKVDAALRELDLATLPPDAPVDGDRPDVVYTIRKRRRAVVRHPQVGDIAGVVAAKHDLPRRNANVPLPAAELNGEHVRLFQHRERTGGGGVGGIRPGR